MSRYRAMIGVIVFALLMVCVFGTPSLVTSFSYIGIDCLVAIGLVLLTGVAGLTSFGQAAFCGVAAYATAKLTGQYGWSPLATLPISLACAALAALILGAITVRLAGHYLVLGTIAWGTGVYYALANIPGLGGFNGMIGLPPIGASGFEITTPQACSRSSGCLPGWRSCWRSNLLDSRIGRAIRSLPARTMAESMGVNTPALKTVVFVVAAVLAGLAGWLQAHQLRVVNPGPFGVTASIDDLFMVVIGGVGSLGGALIGPIVFETLQSWLHEFLPWLLGRSGSFEMAAFGLIILALLQTASSGLMPLLARFLPARPGRRASATAPALPAGSSRRGAACCSKCGAW